MKLLALKNVVMMCTLMLSINAYALDISTHDDVIILSGDSSHADVAALKSALTPAIKTVLLDEVKGNDFTNAWDLADVIKGAKVTTVVKGLCDYNCARMFLSGQVRMFGDGDSLRRTLLFISGNAQEYDSGVMYTDAAHLAALIDMPRNLVDKWAFQEVWGSDNSFSPAFMLVHHPSIKTFNGVSMIGCPGGTTAKEMQKKCLPIGEFDALTAKIITTSELFKIPDSYY